MSDIEFFKNIFCVMIHDDLQLYFSKNLVIYILVIFIKIFVQFLSKTMHNLDKIYLKKKKKKNDPNNVYSCTLNNNTLRKKCLMFVTRIA